MKEKRIYLLFIFALVLLWAGLSLWKHRQHSTVELTKPALDFTLKDQAGQAHRLGDYRGKVVLLNFWASWCGPCRQEMPSLEAFYQKYRDRDFVVLGVSVDEEGWDGVNAFLKSVPVSFPILLDESQQVSELYRTFQIPESYLIDRQGVIRNKLVGPQDFNLPLFSQKIEDLLAVDQK